MPDSRRDLLRLGVRFRRWATPIFPVFILRVEDLNAKTLRPLSSRVEKRLRDLRRVDLHRQLMERAASIGVRMRWGSRVDIGSATSGGHRVTVGGEACAYRYLIGADGEASRVRRWAGLENGSLRSERLGFRRHYRAAPWSDVVEVHWCDIGQAYVTPIASDGVCVVTVTSQRGLNFDSILDDLPYLRDKLRGRRIAGRDRGAVTTTRRLRRVTSGNVALVGDASGSSDAITGTGLASAFREAFLLAESLERDAIAGYERGHARILQLPQAMASFMTRMDRSPWWRDRAMRTLAGSPDIFARMLAVHTGEESLAHFAATQGARFGFRLFMPESNPPTLRESASVDGYQRIA